MEPDRRYGDWFGQSPARFTDQRVRWTRAHGRIVARVRAYRGIARRMDFVRRRDEVVRCDHAHSSYAVARKCGEQLARRLNREAVEQARADREVQP